MSIYLLVLSIDHVVFRPRQLEPDTVGYSVGMLFALPTLRMLLAAPLGSYIDVWGFAWNMVLVAMAVIIFFSGSYSDHDHTWVHLLLLQLRFCCCYDTLLPAPTRCPLPAASRHKRCPTLAQRPPSAHRPLPAFAAPTSSTSAASRRR